MIAALDYAAAASIVRKARELLRLSVGSLTDQRSTTPSTADGSYWVYRRSGRACRVCGELVRMRRQGEQHRSTYFCSTCQSSP